MIGHWPDSWGFYLANDTPLGHRPPWRDAAAGAHELEEAHGSMGAFTSPKWAYIDWQLLQCIRTLTNL